MSSFSGSSIAARFFLVGCARSGTTLLQSLLAAHPDVASFPESHFFPTLAPGARWRRLLRLASPGIRAHLEAFYEDIGHDDACVLPGRRALRMKTYTHAFVATLDHKTTRQGKHRWLEKTPLHLRYVDVIERYVPQVQFIHLVRDGRDVVASMYEVTHEHPEQWGGARSIEKCVTRWTGDVERTRRHAAKANHHVVRYESLTEDPEASLKRLCAALGVDFDSAMLRDYQQRARKVVRDDEPWKGNNTGAIRTSSGRKFHDLFDDEQQARIARAVSGYDLHALAASQTA